MAQNELVGAVDNPIKQQLRNFVVNDASSIARVKTGEIAGYETALGRFYMFWEGLHFRDGVPDIQVDNSFQFTGNETKRNALTSGQPIPELECSITPGTLMKSFIDYPAEKEIYVVKRQNLGMTIEDIKEKTKKQIHEAKKVLLAGTMTPVGLTSALEVLSNYGFNGEVSLYDISDLSVELVNISKPIINKKFPNIKISIEKMDLTNVDYAKDAKSVSIQPSSLGDKLVVSGNEWDIAIFDVIGSYLNDRQLSDLALLLDNLKENGIAFIRDQAMFQTIDNSRRLVATQDKYKRRKEFQDWAVENFQLDITDEDIKVVADNLFISRPNQLYRGDGLLDQWLSSMFKANNNLNWMEYFYFYPKGGDVNERYFMNLLVRKEG